jgi:membrane protease YdiL (CAAX protease family)
MPASANAGAVRSEATFENCTVMGLSLNPFSAAELVPPGLESPDAPNSPSPRTRGRGSFTLTLLTALALALAATVVIAPIAAAVIAKAGFHFPFPRIFDRTVMGTMFASLVLFAGRLKLAELLGRGFGSIRTGVVRTLGGLALAAGAMTILILIAAVVGGHVQGALIPASMLRYLPAAMVIAIIEEGFFRAFLLAGIQDEFGCWPGLLTSSAIFALVHVMRSPARFYLTTFEPAAGAETLAAYAARVVHGQVGSPLLGLFLLGLVLGEAFILSRKAYWSLGLHIGFVLGAKTWRVAVAGAIPPWLAGSGAVPLIAAPAAWIMSAIMLILLPIWLRPDGRRPAL